MGSQTLLIAAGLLSAIVVISIALVASRRRRDYVFIHTPEPAEKSGVPEILRAKDQAIDGDPQPEVFSEMAAVERAVAYADAACAPADEVDEPPPALVYEATAAEHPEVAECEAIEPNPRHAELRMETPVELWFGETRVGVRAHTHTHRQFAKYAEVLLRDLKAAKSEAR